MAPTESWFNYAIQCHIDNGFEEQLKTRLERYRTHDWKSKSWDTVYEAMEDLFIAYTILRDSHPETIEELIQIIKRAEKEDQETFNLAYKVILWTFKPNGALEREKRYTYCMSPIVMAFLIIAYRDLRNVAPFDSIKVSDEMLDLVESKIYERSIDEHASRMCIDGGRPYDDVSMVLAWMVKKGYTEDGPLRPYYY